MVFWYLVSINNSDCSLKLEQFQCGFVFKDKTSCKRALRDTSAIAKHRKKVHKLTINFDEQQQFINAQREEPGVEPLPPALSPEQEALQAELYEKVEEAHQKHMEELALSNAGPHRCMRATACGLHSGSYYTTPPPHSSIPSIYGISSSPDYTSLLPFLDYTGLSSTIFPIDLEQLMPLMNKDLSWQYLSTQDAKFLSQDMKSDQYVQNLQKHGLSPMQPQAGPSNSTLLDLLIKVINVDPMEANIPQLSQAQVLPLSQVQSPLCT